MTTFKTLLASAIVAVSATAAFADSNHQDQRDIYAVFANPVLVEGRNATVARPDLPRSQNDAGIYDVINEPRFGLIEGRNAAPENREAARNDSWAGIYETIHGDVSVR